MKKLLKSIFMDFNMRTLKTSRGLFGWIDSEVKTASQLNLSKESIKKFFTKDLEQGVKNYCSSVESKYDEYFGDRIIVRIEKLSNGYNIKKCHLGIVLDQKGYYYFNSPKYLRILTEGMEVGEVRDYNLAVWNNCKS